MVSHLSLFNCTHFIFIDYDATHQTTHYDHFIIQNLPFMVYITIHLHHDVNFDSIVLKEWRFLILIKTYKRYAVFRLI
jgi:hypothetical protein